MKDTLNCFFKNGGKKKDINSSLHCNNNGPVKVGADSTDHLPVNTKCNDFKLY